MKKIGLLAALLAPAWLPAQFQLVVVEQAVEKTVGESYRVGAIPAGDRIDTAFRLRNTGSASVSLYGLNAAGHGFSFAVLPVLPVNLAGGSFVEFAVRFEPDTAGSYSAYLNINGTRYSILFGTAAAAATLSVQNGNTEQNVAAGQMTDFGAVARGASVTRRFTLANPADESVTVATLSVSGAAFRGPADTQAPLTLKPGESVPFEVTFEPQTTGVHEGILQLERRQYALRGTGIEPVFPRPRIIAEPAAFTGGQQAKLTIRLENPSSVAGSGELSLDFTSRVTGSANDPAVLFPATGTHRIAFTVSKGEDAARFGTRFETEVQTGTTAGTLVLTARLGTHSEQAAFDVASGLVKIDLVRTTRAASGLDVEITGFDTSHSASRLAFRFIDRDGAAVAPGEIAVDAAGAFRSFFDTSAFGGLFKVHAVFPVTGNALQITAIEVDMTNTVGTTMFPRTAIP